jgi:hypothetical protein
MENLIAKIKSNYDLSNEAKRINNGRNDGNYFYVNLNTVIVCNPFKNLSELDQINELTWFAGTREFTIEKQK